MQDPRIVSIDMPCMCGLIDSGNRGVQASSRSTSATFPPRHTTRMARPPTQWPALGSCAYTTPASSRSSLIGPWSPPLNLKDITSHHRFPRIHTSRLQIILAASY
ncbi:hypothetical protein CORC01_11093 [Colletotrichum orchidophilum]|uniref:Uncharacterized protein n=1 Tax=Colletotrichum orchidophilum TaxID=1209926 RepID=A0A1G4AWS9_9PEZI|nr:uncharacterized protein CORC01_11093 [Colletotrichum orchidophilum]OHE93594.1 hypothetical protein CORC01_11093 [Colletotrichum orchidophilum]